MSDTNNLKVFKVVVDKSSHHFLSPIFGFQKSCNLQIKNASDFKSGMFMSKYWFLKIKNTVHTKFPRLALKSEKKLSAEAKADMLTSNKLKSEKKAVFKNAVDISSRLLFRAYSSMSFYRVKVDVFAGKSKEIPSLILKAVKRFAIKNQAHVKLSQPTLKSEKKISLGIMTDVLTGNQFKAEKKLSLENVVDVSSKTCFRSISAMSFGKTRIGVFAGKNKDIPALVLHALKIAKLQEHDGNRLMNIDSIALSELDCLVS